MWIFMPAECKRHGYPRRIMSAATFARERYKNLKKHISYLLFSQSENRRVKYGKIKEIGHHYKTKF